MSDRDAPDISRTGSAAALTELGHDDMPPGQTTTAVPAGAASGAAPPVKRKPWWLVYGVGPYLLLGDTAAFIVATAITRPTSVLHGLALVVTVVTFCVAGLYRSRLSLYLLDDLPYIAGAVCVAVALKMSLLGFVSGMSSPNWQLIHGLALFLAVAVERWAAYAIVRTARTRGFVRHRTIIIGAGDVGVRLARTLQERRHYGLDPVGFLDWDAPTGTLEILQVPVLGGPPQLARVIVEQRITNVIVAFTESNEGDLVDILRTCDRLDVEVFLVPRLYELHNFNRDTDDVYGIPLLRTRRAAFRSPFWHLKRVIDVVIAGVGLVLLSPVMALCALAVRWEGGRGIIFRQERVSLDGRPFQVLKFRSLKPVDEGESKTQWNIKHDSRLGPVGKFLRSTSLDELPQLWNIVRGDMSLVGPRPERPHFVEQFSTHIPRYMARHRVPAGLTGWAQCHGLRGDTSIEDRARFDNYYIENWSPWLDTKIVLKTVGQVLRRQGG
jgi:exopolysaccharide biosynthesis polyprenyl glycosylphosphotransferase